MKELKVKTVTGYEMTFSYQADLIMLHSDFISAQWSPDCTGIEVANQGVNVKVAFHTISKITDVNFPPYQSWYFNVDEFEPLLAWFKSLGFPCPQYERVTS